MRILYTKLNWNFYRFKIIILFFIILKLTTFTKTQEGKIVCYFANWSHNRKIGAFNINSINPFLCTHLVYAFVTFDFPNDGIMPTDENFDVKQGGFKQFNSLKEINSKLKTYASIGGWLEGPLRFSAIAKVPQRRKNFSENTRKFLRAHNFNGISIDWQFPAFRGSVEEDKVNFIKLLQDLNREFVSEANVTKTTKLRVATSIHNSMEYINGGYDLQKLVKYVDFISVLGFDYHLSTEPLVNHHSPLYPLPNELKSDNSKKNVDSTVRFLLSKGVPPRKFLLAIPAYGRTFVLENETNHQLQSLAFSEGEAGNSTRSNEGGYKSYYEICREIKSENWEIVHVNKTSLGPYAHKGVEWVGYDDTDSARRKGQYAAKKNLGGLMFWTIDTDDFSGECDEGRNPLIQAAKKGYLDSRKMKPSNSNKTTNGQKPNLYTNDGKTQKTTLKPKIGDQPVTPTPTPTVIPEKENGSNTYSTISIWITNNIFYFGQTANRSDEQRLNSVLDSTYQLIANIIGRVNVDFPERNYE